MADIFLSYARVDLERVQPIVAALEAHGWEVWWDLTSLRTGQSFNKAIREALGQVKCVVVLWSETSAESRWVEAEAYWAWQKDKLASVVLDDELEPPIPFNTTHAQNLCGWSGDTTAPEYRKLIADLTEVVGSPAEVTKPSPAKEIAGRRIRKPHPDESTEAKKPQQPAKPTSSSRAPGTVYRDLLKDGGEGPELVVIPAGSFVMGLPDSKGRIVRWIKGDDRESPQHEVTLAQPFALGRYLVTFDEYDRFCEATARKRPDDEGWGRGRQPVINVCWDDAVAYCAWLSEQTGKSYRLPTEAEWEYACRAGTTTQCYWGDEPRENRANFCGSGSQWSGKQPSPVGSFDPNPFGLYDMLGNVWEWCQDCWHANYNNAPRDGRVWEEGNGGNCAARVIRGGSWNYDPGLVRSAFRNGDDTVVCHDE